MGQKRGLCRPHGNRGFTLIEVSIVVVITGILAVAAIPALQSVADINHAGGRAEVERQVVLARSVAIATGAPQGVVFDLTRSSFAMVTIPSIGVSPQATRDALGNETAETVLDSKFGGATIRSFTNGDSVAGSGTLWFGYDGTPQIRDSAGALSGTFSVTATVGLSGGFEVRINRAGAIER